ncbi:MAG: CoA-binding protein [Bacteroidetes bacterium]|nr:CoA-binding protein [Bacteroidota bacterium]
MTTLETINEFMQQKHIAVAGVSRKKQKFGNVIYTELIKKGHSVYPVNPNIEEFEGQKCYRSIASLPEEVTGIVINTKPEITATLVHEAELKGIKWIWLQQGSADKATLREVQSGSPGIIGGQCVLMFADPVKGVHGFHRWLKKTFHQLPK